MICLQISAWTVLTLMRRSWFVWHQCCVAKQQWATHIPHLVPLILWFVSIPMRSWSEPGGLVSPCACFSHEVTRNGHIHLTQPSGTGWTCAKLWELVKKMHHMDCGENKQKRKWHRNRRWRNGMVWKMREGHCYSLLDNRTTGVTDTYIKTSYLSKAALSSSTQTAGQKCTLNCNTHKRKMRFMYICPTFYIQLCFELYILFPISSFST